MLETLCLSGNKTTAREAIGKGKTAGIEKSKKKVSTPVSDVDTILSF